MSKFAGNKFSFESDFLPKFKGEFKAYVNSSYFIDIGIPEDYFIACERFK
ncbi:Uncharacterised protein [Escherichia coli]|nr:Uncharacterised protein [Escherichia coli]